MDSRTAHLFNRRVQLLIEVTDDPDEISLAQDLLTAEGWTVRDPTDEEAAPVGPRRRGLVVEVRLRGARRGARKEAVRRVEQLAARACLGLWVRRSMLLQPPQEWRTEYRVRLIPPTEGTRFARWALRLVRRVDGSHDQRALSRPGPPDRAAAVDEMADSWFGTGAYDPTTEAVHGPADSPDGSATRPMDLSTGEGLLKVCLWTAALVGSLLGCLAAAGVLYVVDSLWRWAVLLPVLMLAIPLGAYFTPHTWPRYRKVLGGLGEIAAMLGVGYLTISAMPVSSDRILVVVPLTALGVGLFAWTAYGVWLALVPSWFSRNASWLLPALLAPLYFLLPWFGKLLYVLYLSLGFDIPVDAIPVTTYSFMYAGLKPIGLAAGFALFFVAVAGWARHFYWGNSSGGGIPAFLLPAVAAQYVLTALLFGALTAGTAWSEAADAVKAGRNPASYYGLSGKLMCVRPQSKDVAIYNGPLPTHRPVLTFGSTGERIWLWGPQDSGSGGARWASMSVRLEDVTLTPARPGGRCASARN
ncbi:hypothetical protein [Streptomyces syringium]|uniref:hypothetical protein n=1 Tax=Streptomyces syringium TaxID=76729 RepID=UPI0033DFAFCA